MLPVPAPITGPSWSEARQQGRAIRAAGDAARAGARGGSIDETIVVLGEEYARRGVRFHPSTVADHAERLHLERQPLGRARLTLRTAAVLVDAGRRVVEHVRGTAEDPGWMRPPGRAGYPVTAGGATRDATAVVDDTATDILARVLAEAPRRVGDAAIVDLWFSAADPAAQQPAITVQLGTHPVGTLPPDYDRDFAAIFMAAAIFDEDPVASGTLQHPTGGAWYLEFTLPQRPDVPADAAGSADAPTST